MAGREAARIREGREVKLFARAVYALVSRLAARRGLGRQEAETEADERRQRLRTGVRAETLAYWYLRRQGYIIVCRNFRSPHGRGEIDLIGWDGDVLAFIEVKARTTASGGPPEAAVNPGKQHKLRGTAREYLIRHRLGEVPYRFDVLALEARRGSAPVVRLHKGAFGGT